MVVRELARHESERNGVPADYTEAQDHFTTQLAIATDSKDSQMQMHALQYALLCRNFMQ